MSAEEIEILFTSFKDAIKAEETSNSPIYVLISVVVVIAPFVFRYFRKTFVSSIEKVMKVHVDKMDDMFRIMEMHIDELAHVKLEAKETREKVEETKEKVINNSAWIDTFKEKCL